MLKKIIGMVMVSLFLSVQCFAMTFSQPVELGWIGGTPMGGFWIHGADYNNGNSYQNGKYDKTYRDKLYGTGVAGFGTNNNGLWIYYDDTSLSRSDSPIFGDKKQTVTVSLGASEGEKVHIHKIPNDENMEMYFLFHGGCAVGTEVEIIMGYDKNGKFVKYIDTRDVVKNYLGEKNFGVGKICLKNCYCRGDSIIIEYMDTRRKKGYKSPSGAFRFKWDDKAQWFGVEQVVY